MSATAPTWDRIRKEIERRNEATKPRDITALSKMQEEMGADFDHPAHVFFRDDEAFKAAVEAHVAAMTSRSGGPASSASRSQRRSGLRRVRAIAFEVADEGDAGWDTLPNAITSCRRRLGLSKYKMAQHYGGMLRDYEYGKSVPRERAKPLLERFADDAGVDREKLIRFVTSRGRPRSNVDADSPSRYGLAAMGYEIPGMPSTQGHDRTPKTPLPATCPLKGELEEFISFKTSRIPPAGLVRHKKSKWTTNAHGECHSAVGYMTAVSQFFGFLHRILGVPLDALTLPMMGDCVLLQEWDRFLQQRGLVGLSDDRLLLPNMLVKNSVTAPGYVRQQRTAFEPAVHGPHGYLGCPPIRALYARRFGVADPEARDAAGMLDALRCVHHDVDDAARLPDGDRDRFDDWCDFNARVLASWMESVDSDDDEYASRDAVYVLINESSERQERPMNVLKELQDALAQERARYPSADHNDVLSIDYAMAIIAFEGSIPLREGNLRSVRLHPNLVHDDARDRLPPWRPSLYRAHDGGLLFSEHHSYFKNRASLAKRGINYFKSPIAPWAVPHLDYFLQHVRPRLPGAAAGSPYLFPGLSPRERLHKSKLGDRMEYVTRQVFGRAFRIHWFRHLIATDILATHPEALKFVADLLQDELETVMRMYDRSQPADAARFAHRYQDLVMAA